MTDKKIKKIIESINRGTSQIIPKTDLIKKLESGKKLKIKFGADPTAPDLHLGHSVVLSKLRELQDMGHEIIFLIGDFTARIGDPTGRSKTRPSLTKGQIEYNTKTYFEQISKILDPTKITIRYNSEWLEKLNCDDMIRLCAKFTVAKLIEREDFSNRLKEKSSISFHELLYPIFQAYDSVVLESDIEFGGVDQILNMLIGRFLQEQFEQEPQVIITMPLLEGLDGIRKMSKSLDNSIGFSDAPNEAFGKLMSIPDILMWKYFELLLHKDSVEISKMQERIAAGNLNPMELKKNMSHDIVAKFWSTDEAEEAEKTFESLFQKKDYSMANKVELPKNTENPIWIVELLRLLEAVKTSSEAKRLIEAGAVSINDEKISNFKIKISWESGTLLKVGKHRIYRLQ